MRVLYHIPFVNTIYAGRNIYHGYKNAFTDLGHNFKPWTADDNGEKLLDVFQPEILMCGLGSYNLKYIDIPAIRKHKRRGMKVFVNTPFWKTPISRLRINETPSLCESAQQVSLIREGYGDLYYNVCEQGDERMEGFEKTTGYRHYTFPLAADKTLHFPEYNEKFKADVSFVGTNLPDKRPYFDEYVFPLKKNYDLKLYGQDWTTLDKVKSNLQKVGHYFNVPILKNIQKPKLQLEQERQVYTSSVVCINVHENYQRKFGKDCNERTFKIPVCGGFEITDEVECIKKYFKEGFEIVIAKDKKDWFEKIEYYIKNPDKRDPIIKAGRERVLSEHTYHNRVYTILSLCKEIN